MSVATNLIRYGRDGRTGQYDDLWLPVFGAEVLTAFQERTLFPQMVNRKTITTGNEMKFPATWKIGSDYHEAGTEIMGFDVETKEYTIRLDDRPLYSAVEFDDIDAAMAHFDVRSELAAEAGRELARQIDFKTACLILQASRTAAPANSSFMGGGFDGNGAPAKNTAVATANRAGAIAFLDLLEQILVRWDEIDVPEEERYVVCKPDMWYAIRKLGFPSQSSEAGINLPVFGHADFDRSSNPGLNQQMARETPLIVHNGLPVYRHNRIPSTNVSSETKLPEKYRGNYSTTVGMAFQKTCIAHLELMGVTSERGRDIRTQSDLMVTKTLTGGGTLRPYCAVEITSDS